MNNSVIAKFIDDRDSLSSEELDMLITELQSDTELAGRLHALLTVDDLLGRAMLADRADFVSQVQQRLDDLRRESEPTGAAFEKTVMNQVAKQNSRISFNLYPLLALAASVLVVVGIWMWPGTRGPAVTSSVAALRVIRETVILKDLQGKRIPALTAEALRDGCWVETMKDGLASLVMDGGETVLEIRKESGVRCQVSDEGQKNFFLKKGGLTATVAKQKASAPMILGTDFGSATVLGTKLAMMTTQAYSRMDVISGAVEWRLQNKKQAMIVRTDQHVVADKNGQATVFGVPIFEEDFPIDLSNWVIYGEDAEGKVYKLPPKDLARVRTVKISRNGKKNKALQIDAVRFPGWINLTLKSKITNSMFIVMLDYKAISPKKNAELDIVCRRKETTPSQILFKGGQSLRVNRWSSSRSEYTTFLNEKGETEVREKKYQEENILGFWSRSTSNDPANNFVLRLSTKKMKAQLSNIRIIPILSSTLDPKSRKSWIIDPSVLLPYAPH